MARLRTRILYDPAEPVTVAAYAMEAMALVDQAVLGAADIPSMVRCDRAGEIVQRAWLVVRREHAAEARQILNAPDRAEPESRSS